MNPRFCPLFVIVFVFQSAAVIADEINFGRHSPSVDEVVQQFRATPDVGDSDEYEIPSGKVRGLKVVDKPQHKKNQLAEKAISLEVLFPYNSFELTDEAKSQLGTIGQAMAVSELKGMHYRVEGHTDAVGGDQFNMNLSQQRAEAVREFLLNNAGLSAESINSIGKGKQDLADRENPSSEVNRRVRIVRLAN